MNGLARLLAAAALAAAGAATAAETTALRNLQPGDDPAASPVWQKVQASLFEGRAIAPAPAGMLQLDAPARAVDAAVVPIAIRSKFPHTAANYVARLYLIIDANPSPISGIFGFTPESGRAEVETRVRVDAYSHVRAIAETSDGKLYGVTRFVKASGGCSAPPGSDAKAALATLMIDHPNHSGLAMDQYTRQFTPAHYVRKVEVSYAGKPVFSADVDFSMSENPNFRFWFQPQLAGGGAGELRATVVDSQELRFVAAQALRDSPK